MEKELTKLQTHGSFVCNYFIKVCFMKISLCMIVKDEEATLTRCLNSIKSAVDEIIIVDTGSQDSTKSIALEFTDLVFDFVWIDDFSAARNFSFSKATGDYIMWLDADDVISADNLAKLKSLKEELPSNIDIVYMLYHVGFGEDGKPNYTYYRERLVKRCRSPVWVEPVHEVIEVSGEYKYTDIAIEHRKVKLNPAGRNLKILEKERLSKKILSPRLTYYYARELMYNQKYLEAIRYFTLFLDEGKGSIEDCLSACRDLAFCYQMLYKYDDALDAVLRGLRYSVPRAELLCKIGELMAAKQDYANAEYWYLLALNSKKPKLVLGFLEEDYYGYIPALELCVICYKLGKTQDAIKYNELAGGYKPASAAYTYNKKFFEVSNNKS